VRRGLQVRAIYQMIIPVIGIDHLRSTNQPSRRGEESGHLGRGMRAMASISISASLGSLATSTVDLAGGKEGK